MASFAQSISSNRNENLYLVHGGRDRTNQSVWHFIRVERAKTKAFMHAIKTGSIDLSAFGEILESGYGEEPPPAMLSYMKANYGFAA
jgi:hypothetical protein